MVFYSMTDFFSGWCCSLGPLSLFPIFSFQFCRFFLLFLFLFSLFILLLLLVGGGEIGGDRGIVGRGVLECRHGE